MISIALIGVGLVGTEVLEQIVKLPKHLFRIVAITNSKNMLLLGSDDDPTQAKQQLANGNAIDFAKLSAYLMKFKPCVIVDNTSSEQVARNYPAWLSQNIHVVTPNKKAFSSDYALYKSIMSSNACIFHESSVGAGLPLTRTMKSLKRTGDRILKIEGILSGTLSYIFNQFSSKGNAKVKFSDVVKIAKEKGFTEPDPRDDLNGMDVARKIVILARVAGANVSLEDVNLQNILPTELLNCSSDEFINRLSLYDSHFEKLNEQAKAEAKVLRFVGSFDFTSGVAKVSLEKYAADHPFACLGGSDNILSIATERFPLPNPMIIQGSGAGAAVTAFGVVEDLFQLAEIVNGKQILP